MAITKEDILEYNRSAILRGEEEPWIMVYKGNRQWDVSLFLCVFRRIMRECRREESLEK